MKKRYYKIGEQVWNIPHRTVGVVKSIDTENKKMTIYAHDAQNGEIELTNDLWEFDKLRGNNEFQDGVVAFTRFRDSAVRPYKGNREDAGYDVYLDIPKDFTYVDAETGETKNAWVNDVLHLPLKKSQVHLLPTGVGVIVDKQYYTHWANERGSTGKLGIALLSGIVDSGYRGEVFLNVLPLQKDIVITSSFSEVKIGDDEILFPYTKAIAQMIPHRNLQLLDIEMPVEDFKKQKSIRGANKLGSTDAK